MSCTENGIYLYKMVDRKCLLFRSTPVFSGGCLTRSFVLCVIFVYRCLSFVLFPLAIVLYVLLLFTDSVSDYPFSIYTTLYLPISEVAVICSHIHNYISGLLCNGHLKLSRNTSRCENNSYYKHGRWKITFISSQIVKMNMGGCFYYYYVIC